MIGSVQSYGIICGQGVSCWVGEFGEAHRVLLFRDLSWPGGLSAGGASQLPGSGDCADFVARVAKYHSGWPTADSSSAVAEQSLERAEGLVTYLEGLQGW